MFIETEQTPNPATLKFLPGRSVMATGTADFTDAEKAERSPLAARLFLIEGVTGVFLGTDAARPCFTPPLRAAVALNAERKMAG